MVASNWVKFIIDFWSPIIIIIYFPMACFHFFIIEYLTILFHSTKVETNHLIIRVGNPDEWCTQNCLPQDCLPVGISEVGNPEGNQLSPCHFGHKEWLLSLETLQTFDQSDVTRKTNSEFLLAEIFKVTLITVLAKKIFKLRNFI